MLLLREILDPKYGMFKEYEETRAIWFSEDTFEEEDVYLLIGKFYNDMKNVYFIGLISPLLA